MLPSLFIAHGSPMIAIEESGYGTFLDHLGESLARPQAIVIFSAHWESRVQQVSAVESYSTIYDFGGFPDELYRVTYPAHGNPALAARIHELLKAAEVPVELDHGRGLDHGAWTLLNRLYPAADIPVVAMSVNARLTPEEQFRIGQTLSPLRSEGVLIIGSGVTVHNFQLLQARHNAEVQSAIKQFEAWLESKLHAWDLAALFHYETEAPYARLAVPANGQEHFAPLFYAMGAGSRPESVETLHQGWMWDVMTNSVYAFR